MRTGTRSPSAPLQDADQQAQVAGRQETGGRQENQEGSRRQGEKQKKKTRVTAVVSATVSPETAKVVWGSPSACAKVTARSARPEEPAACSRRPTIGDVVVGVNTTDVMPLKVESKASVFVASPGFSTISCAKVAVSAQRSPCASAFNG